MSEQLVERVCDVNSSLTPEYLLPSQWIPVLAVYSLPLRIKYLFTLYQRVAQKLSDMWCPSLEITAAQLPSVTESRRNQISYVWTYVHTWASGSDDRGNPIPRVDINCLIVDWLIDWVNRSPTRYDFHASARAILDSVNIAGNTYQFHHHRKLAY